MKDIQITYCKGSGFDPFFDNIKTISIDDAPFAGGGFGDIYFARLYNGKKAPMQQVVKVFKPGNPEREAHSWGTITRLQEQIQIAKEGLGLDENTDFFEEYPALSAFPQLVFQGELDGREVKGCSTNELNAMGLVGFDEIIDDESSKYIDDYLEKDMEWRLTTAYHLVRGFNFLKSAHFIHADISSDNVFVSLERPVAVILDFDSGAVVQSVDDNPSTFGKFQPWLAPEIAFQLKEGNKNGNCLVNLTEFTDRWSVAHAVFNLLLVMDAFYIKDMSKDTLERYLKKYKWPNIENDDPLFNGEEEAYEFFRDIYETLPDKIKDEFEYTFTKGVFDPKSRTSYYKWEMILQNLIPSKARKKITPASHGNSLSNIASSSNVRSSLSNVRSLSSNVTSSANANAQQELVDYINALVQELAAGKKKVYKKVLQEKAKAAGKDGEQVLKDVQEFVALFNASIEDGVITKLEKASLINMGKIALVTAETIEKMLEPYSMQKMTPIVKPIIEKKPEAKKNNGQE